MGDKTFNNISLVQVSDILGNVKKGDVITLTHPLFVDSHDPLTLRVYSRLSSLRVMVDDKQIYSYGVYDVLHNRMVGSGYHFVLLPSRYYGRMLKIELIASEDGALTSAPDIVITRAEEAITTFAKDRIFGIMSGLFMFMTGLAFIVLSIIAIYMDGRFYPIAAAGAFSCAAGIWCLSTIKALQLFSGDITLNTIMEYLSMYFLPVPVLFLSAHFRSYASPRTKVYLDTATATSALFFLFALILQVSGITDVTRVVSIFHVMLIPIGLVLLFSGTAKWRRMKASEKMFQTGLYLIAIMVIVEVSAYYIINMFYRLSNNIKTIVPPIALLILDVIMAIGFLLEIYDMRLKDSERNRLQRLAYRDQMTGLLNRGECKKRLDELARTGEDFVILDMDLNGLKEVNDHYGHFAGDEYITVFSDIIKKVFGGDEDLYRVGGDEFLYISTKMSEVELYRKAGFIKKLEKMTERETGCKYSIDTSFGIADSRTLDSKNPEDVYRIADKRMYDMKKSSNKERK